MYNNNCLKLSCPPGLRFDINDSRCDYKEDTICQGPCENPTTANPGRLSADGPRFSSASAGVTTKNEKMQLEKSVMYGIFISRSPVVHHIFL